MPEGAKDFTEREIMGYFAKAEKTEFLNFQPCDNPNCPVCRARGKKAKRRKASRGMGWFCAGVGFLNVIIENPSIAFGFFAMLWGLYVVGDNRK